MKKTIKLAVILSLLFQFLDMSPVLADDSDIFGRNIQPNVMILFDSSGSMNNQIVSQPYDPSTTYPGNRTFTRVYRRRFRGGYSFYRNTIGDVPKANARTALSSSGFWSGRIGGSRVRLFVGNYLNYQSCPSCSGLERKIDIAKRLVINLINNVEGVRFGVMKFANNSTRGSGGAGMVGAIGTNTTTIINAVNSINPSGWTPLGEQLRDAGLYYKGVFGFSSPIEYWCQVNAVIIVSDGLQNGSVDVRNEATTRFTQDHDSLLTATQNVIVHTIGFAIDSSEAAAANDVLQTAATNGGGNFYSADNPNQLEAALQDAIHRIIAATFSFASPVIPTTSAAGNSKAYLAAFQSDSLRPFWRGFLKAYQRDSSGQIEVDGNGVPLDSALIWEAGQQLSQKTPESRTIFTHVSSSREDFVKTNGTITPSLLGVSTSAERDKIIDFIRGIDAFDADGDFNVTEDRPWKLGDFFHSTPVLVTPPSLFSTDSGYLAFKQAKASRTTALIVGANDGMLHAFRESDGEELWAFIPADFLDRLKDLTVRSGDHPFYLDSSPIAADIKIGGSWKTIVVFGERRGGKSYHSLDITDTANPSFLWSFSDSKLGETWSEPTIGKVKMSDGTEKFVAFVGGGHDTDENNNSGKAFFIIDLATGGKLWEYYNDGSSDDRQFMNFSLAASPTAVDLNNDGFIDWVYIGDIGGQLWKFDVSAGATLSGGLVTNWTGKRLFAGDPSQANPPPAGEYYPSQAIYVPPVLTFDQQGDILLFFGTGDRNHPLNTSTNRFYGIKDNTTMATGSTLTESDLVDVTSTDATAVQGWFFRLGADEKVLAAADVFNEVVFISTFTPTNTAACGSGEGTAKVFAVQFDTGFAAISFSTGDLLAVTDSSINRSTDIGSGIPSSPTVIIDLNGNARPSVITGTTNQQIISIPAPPISLRQIVGWREVY